MTEQNLDRTGAGHREHDRAEDRIQPRYRIDRLIGRDGATLDRPGANHIDWEGLLEDLPWTDEPGTTGRH